MSSATSTEAVGPGPDAGGAADQPLQPWQFFVLAGLACATVATFLARGDGVAGIVLLTAMMGGAAGVGIAALRALRPLLGRVEERTAMIGERTRAALEREKLLALRAIKELEFDRAMGKLSEADFHEMSGRLRGRAARLIRQLDAGSGYRDQIERELARRVGAAAAAAAAIRTCPSCSTTSEADARFCRACGTRLRVSSEKD
ncbi:MAG: zinc ribbon domain-containing protein [Acidobacteria bacterium]|nr:zinc ribbon domain-containing protein [Acidobacteriota bacterium]